MSISGLVSRVMCFMFLGLTVSISALRASCLSPLLKVSGKRLWGFFKKMFGTADAWGGGYPYATAGAHGDFRKQPAVLEYMVYLSCSPQQHRFFYVRVFEAGVEVLH